MKNEKKYEFINKLSPNNTEELEEILNKYPFPEKQENRKNNNEDFNSSIVDEPVEVISKNPWYRSRVLAAAASLTITVSVIGIGIIKTADSRVSDLVAYSTITSPTKTTAADPVETEAREKAEERKTKEMEELKRKEESENEHKPITTNRCGNTEVEPVEVPAEMNEPTETTDDKPITTNKCGNTEVEETEHPAGITASTETTAAEPVEIASYDLEPITVEWKNTVFFGSEFPYIIYADEEKCIFTEGISSIFVYDFVKRDIVFSANIRDTLTKNNAPEFDSLSFFSCKTADDTLLILCNTAAMESDTNYYYNIDIENKQLLTADNSIINEDITKETGNSDPHPEITDSISQIKSFGDGGYIYIANNGLANDVTPGNGSHLTMIDIVVCKEKHGDAERYRPFK